MHLRKIVCLPVLVLLILVTQDLLAQSGSRGTERLQSQIESLNALLEKETPSGAKLTLPPQQGRAEPQATPSVEKGDFNEFEQVLKQISALRQLRRENEGAPSEPKYVSTPATPPTPTPTAETDPQESTTAETAAMENVPAGNRLLESPADAVLLAHSLYRVKNYESAYKVLEDIDATKFTKKEQTWLKMLRALALRRMGQTDKATAILRELANDRQSPYKSEIQWWLSHFEVGRSRAQSTDKILMAATKAISETDRYVK